MKKLFFGDTIDGWGVIRDQPYDFGGVYSSRAEAQAVASRLGPEYAVRYGQNRKGTCGFRTCTAPSIPDEVASGCNLTRSASGN